MDNPSVLTIQSHVVAGYVGNKSAVFPMQVLGFEVSVINSVQFSNHSGYGYFPGQILNDTDLKDLMDGLRVNDHDNFTHLLTGYIGSPSFLLQISKSIKNQLRKKNPRMIYVCDPVLGDNGKLYVSEELIPIYKDVIIPLANIITPNIFEAEILSDTKINNPDDVWKAVEVFHEKGCPTVIISSAEFGNASELTLFASTRKDKSLKLTMKVKKIPATFTGTGDLFAALMLAWMHKLNNNLKEALENTIATMQAVLKRTFDQVEGKEFTAKNLELKLVQSKSDIENPNVIYQATMVN